MSTEIESRFPDAPYSPNYLVSVSDQCDNVLTRDLFYFEDFPSVFVPAWQLFSNCVIMGWEPCSIEIWSFSLNTVVARITVPADLLELEDGELFG